MVRQYASILMLIEEFRAIVFLVVRLCMIWTSMLLCIGMKWDVIENNCIF
jgi:hypothetical protein